MSRILRPANVNPMPEDLPIYPESILRTRLQFEDLERLKGIDTTSVWEKSDKFIEQFEGAIDGRRARESLTGLTKPNLLRAHAILFGGREDAGLLRRGSLNPLIGVKTVPLRNSSTVLCRIFSIGCQLKVFLRSTRSNERPLCLRGLPIYGRLNSVTSPLLWFAETSVWAKPALLRSFFHRNM